MYRQLLGCEKHELIHAMCVRFYALQRDVEVHIVWTQFLSAQTLNFNSNLEPNLTLNGQISYVETCLGSSLPAKASDVRF